MNKHLIFLILAFIIALMAIPYLKVPSENFSNLGIYPTSVTEPILFKDYPLQDPLVLSNNTYRDNYPYDPVFGSSYGQYTNNVRYWATPDDSSSAPAEFGNTFYNNKIINPPKTPSAIPFSSPDIRVNYYGSHVITCPNQ